MNNQIEKEILSIKKRIIRENKLNPNKRRLFSKPLKRDIVSFVSNHAIQTRQAATMLGIGPSTLEKWVAKESHFKKLSVVNEKKSVGDDNFQYHQAIKTNQFVLITLTALSIVKRLFAHLFF